MLKPKRWLTNQWIWKELCTTGLYRVKGPKRSATFLLGLSCATALHSKEQITNQWIWKELCTTNRIVWTGLNAVLFVWYDSFVLLYSVQNSKSRINEFERSCVQLIVSCEWALTQYYLFGTTIFVLQYCIKSNNSRVIELQRSCMQQIAMCDPTSNWNFSNWHCVAASLEPNFQNIHSLTPHL